MPTVADKTSLKNVLPWVRYAEVWHPCDEHTFLERAATVVVGSQGITAESEVNPARVKSGQGIVGQAWHQKSPVIFHEQPSHLLDEFRRTSGVPLTAIIVVPVFRLHEICGAVVLGLGEGNGAMEVWSRDERDELGVSASYYQGLPALEFISRYTRLPRGSSLPGKVWKTEEPKLIVNPTASEDFVRSLGTDSTRIGAAIGIPVGSSHGFAGSVLVMLSDSEQPVSNGTELWFCEAESAANDDDPIPTLAAVHTAAFHSAPDHSALTQEPWRQNVMESIRLTQGPVLVTTDDLTPSAGNILAMPVYHGKRLTSVLALRFADTGTSQGEITEAL